MGLKNPNEKTNTGKAKWGNPHYRLKAVSSITDSNLLISYWEKHHNHSWQMLRFGNLDALAALLSWRKKKVVQVHVMEARAALLCLPAPNTNTFTERCIIIKHTV